MSRRLKSLVSEVSLLHASAVKLDLEKDALRGELDRWRNPSEADIADQAGTVKVGRALVHQCNAPCKSSGEWSQTVNRSCHVSSSSRQPF